MISPLYTKRMVFMKYKIDDKEFHIGVNSEEIGRYVILPGDPKRCKMIASYLVDAKKIQDKREFTTYTGYLEGVAVSVVSTGIGGPSTAIAVEELVHCGAHTFIRIGTAGGMDTKVKGGDIVIANASIRAEGTTQEYAPLAFPAISNFDVTNALIQASQTLHIPYHVGVVQSKDSFYGQHEPEKKAIANHLISQWEAWMAMGTLASEMESAALFIVAQSLRVRAGACFLVLANQEREKQGLSNEPCYDVDKAIRIAIEGIKNLIMKDKEVE